MSVNRDNADKLYLTLTRATKAGELSWSREQPSELKTQLTARINGFYTATYEEAEFALLELVNRAYDAEVDEYFLVEGIELALLDDTYHITYTFPFTESLPGLLDAVKAQTSGANAVLKRILGAAAKKKPSSPK